MLVTHEFGPWYDTQSRVLVLGTMPSPKSREAGFYYAHPQNRFWRVLPALYGEPPLIGNITAQQDFLTRRHIALWDVLASCEIEGASDSSIRNPVPNDMNVIYAPRQSGRFSPRDKRQAHSIKNIACRSAVYPFRYCHPPLLPTVR